MTVYTLETLPQYWATTQNNLGLALKEQALIAPKEKKEDLFNQAVTAFKLALEVRTREHLPYDWEQTKNNLEETYKAMEEWKKAE
ncbi:tetratricopeptide repeat-containing [Desulfonema limicola]|uniref:Tetratricopeptide repeat-containing n=1 Tax=Desulfonema limicola TaxID=45656 RepID=A0A975B631_9BACT|nr:hypothetical protein [Desulfonema limicola]QTA79449.1 tetratricopeptide repeat-containing [Desulfonema limicola]